MQNDSLSIKGYLIRTINTPDFQMLNTFLSMSQCSPPKKFDYFF
jgi:hypothetical protein